MGERNDFKKQIHSRNHNLNIQSYNILSLGCEDLLGQRKINTEMKNSYIKVLIFVIT
jgi:hypothetical protein